MQPVPAYHPQNYPPEGAQWPRFGDPQLDRALASISAEAHAALVRKRVDNQPMHMERLHYHSHALRTPAAHEGSAESLGAAEQPIETLSDPGYVSAGDAEGEQEGEASQPSGIRRMASGIGHVVRNYVYPATRDIIAPAMADAAVHGAKGLIWLTARSAWTAAQLFMVLNGGEGEFPEFLGDEQSSSSSSARQALTWNSEADADEIERLSKKGKGFLVEELYKTKGWREVFEQEDARGYANDESALFRKKLGQMSKRDLAEVLVKLNKNQ